MDETRCGRSKRTLQLADATQLVFVLTEAVSDTRRRVGKHMREIDRVVTQDNYMQVRGMKS